MGRDFGWGRAESDADVDVRACLCLYPDPVVYPVPVSVNHVAMYVPLMSKLSVKPDVHRLFLFIYSSVQFDHNVLKSC